jgi:hypothetical protein
LSNCSFKGVIKEPIPKVILCQIKRPRRVPVNMPSKVTADGVYDKDIIENITGKEE